MAKVFLTIVEFRRRVYGVCCTITSIFLWVLRLLKKIGGNPADDWPAASDISIYRMWFCVYELYYSHHLKEPLWQESGVAAEELWFTKRLLTTGAFSCADVEPVVEEISTPPQRADRAVTKLSKLKQSTLRAATKPLSFHNF